ncbi:MAG: DUF5658 family protein, partial [Actinomycetota bacterium]
GCGFIKTDRRQGSRFSRVAAYERRVMSHWIPDLYRAGSAAALETIREGRRRSAILGVPTMLVFLLLLFNVLDISFTLRALSLGIQEANPAMAFLFNISVPAGILAKSLVVGIGSLALWRFSHLVIAFRALVAVTGLYGAVVFYHLLFQAGL